MRETIPTSRRSIIKTIGGGAALATVGGGALLAATGGASASLDSDYNTVSISSDDGSVQYVAIHGDSIVNWDGFDTTAQAFSITLTAEVVQDWDGQTRVSETELHSTGRVDLSNSSWGNYDESLSGPGTSGTIETGIGLDDQGNHDPSIDWHVVGSDPDGYGLPTTSLDASALAVGGDGDTRSFTIVLRSTYAWYDAVSGGSQIFSKTFRSDLPVDVTNEPATSSTSSDSGTDGATGA